MAKVEEKGSVDGRDDYTEDGSVDLKGRPVLRSETGRWKACSFIVGYEVFERMAYYGIASNLVLYLTKKLHEGTVKSANNVNNWVGTVWMTPILGAYIADAHLGLYWTFVIASAIYLTSGQNSPWMLCTVTQVEETKQMGKMIPVLMVTFIPSTLLAQVGTLFVKQGTTLDRRMGPHFEIPPACLTAFVTIFMLITIAIYDRYFVPTVRRYTKNPRGITLIQRMGIGLMLQIIIMTTACFAERKRLSVVREHQKFGKNDTEAMETSLDKASPKCQASKTGRS
ncbi:Proton-dependent oligopeptide transporter family - like 2 [Theobroma cacao]|nr:Proton-dependent oligopeptide transporter family - like 2 [Theobroma cacao]